MALINCPECNQPVSDTCDRCIHCGYTLSRINSANNAKPVRKPRNKQGIIKKLLLSSALILSVVIVVILIGILTNRKNDQDVFSKLYYSPPREQVLLELGQPDDTTYSEGNVWCDRYNSIEFLGETGKLTIYYRGSGCVTSAEFDVVWSKSDPDSKQQAHKYADNVTRFYTKLFGEIKSGVGQFSTSPDYWAATSSDRINLFDTVNFSGDSVVSIHLE